MNSEDPPSTTPPRWVIWLLGMIVGNAIGALLYVGTAWLIKVLTGPGGDTTVSAWTFGITSLLIVPMIAGLSASGIWRALGPNFGQTAIATLLMSILGMAGAAVILREGAICLIIVWPLYFIMSLAGTLMGRVIFPSDRTRMRLVIFPLLAAYALVELATREDRTSVVTDEILIQARPDQVWPNVTSFPDIPEPPTFWLFRLGLPYPMATTTEGDYVGAKRACIFSGDAVFEEVVSELDPGKTLTFDIVKLPNDPELIGHLTPQRGRFSLRDNGDGTTTLTGDTWYSLHVRPLSYFDWWTHHIFRAVHLRVMENIRLRSENANRS